MQAKLEFNTHEALELGNLILIDWSKISLEDFQAALNAHITELQSKPNPQVSDTDPITVARAALARLTSPSNEKQVD